MYRQYDHEVGLRTVVRPGADAALLAVDEADADVALAAGAPPAWTGCAPEDGARAVAVAAATDLAAVRATLDGVAPVTAVGRATDAPGLSLTADGASVALDAETVAARRATIDRALD